MLKNKKALFILGALVVVFIVTMIIISLVVTRPLEYVKIENIMQRAAINYYNDNIEEFDVTSGTVLTISTNHLVDYMKPLETMLEEGVYCDGVVRISNVNNNVAFFPFLDCGADYRTQTLVNFIKNNEEVVEEGPGLYENNGSFIYRGSKVDNWLSFDGRYWRIMEITDNNELRIVETTTRRRTIWDSRLNPDRDGRPGVNDFRDVKTEHSDIRYFLADLIESEDYLTPTLWGYLSYMDLCIGKRAEDDKSVSGRTECSELFEDQLIGLLTVYEFLRTSLDDDCQVATDIFCQNFNYLTEFPFSTWMLTAVKDSTHEVYHISTSNIKLMRVNRSLRAVTTVTLNPHVLYSVGDGSVENPYIIY